MSLQRIFNVAQRVIVAFLLTCGILSISGPLFANTTVSLSPAPAPAPNHTSSSTAASISSPAQGDAATSDTSEAPKDFLVPPSPIETNSAPSEIPADPADTSDTLVFSRLIEVSASLEELTDRINTLRIQIQATPADLHHEDYAQLTARLSQLESQRRNLRVLFENIATGGVDRSVFSDPPPKTEFDWQNELLAVARPLIAELNKLTERPRMLEALRSQSTTLQEKITISEQAIGHLRQNIAEATALFDPATLAHMNQLIEDWEQVLADFVRQEHLLQMQIDSQFSQEESVYAQSRRLAKEFLIGRGLVLLLAILLFSLSTLLIQGSLNRILSYRHREEIIRASPQKRFVILMLRTIGWLFSIFLFLMTLYVAGDVVLFSLIVVILALLLIASRNYLPRYFEEAKLFLNIGPVRENERIIYQDLPWKVKSIGFQVWLENPELTNGRLRLPMQAIKGLTSRPLYSLESWFPTRRGEYVILKDYTFGRVEEQTPEFVCLNVLHATKTYITREFLAAQPQNLSRENFILNPVTSLDLSHQREDTAKIAALLEQQIDSELKASPYAEHIMGTSVAYLQASRSSLDFQILVSVSGAAAKEYFKLQRMIQSTFLATCRRQGWRLAIEQHQVNWPTGLPPESTFAPTKSAGEPTKSAGEPTQSAAEPTQSAAEPTQSAAEPAQENL